MARSTGATAAARWEEAYAAFETPAESQRKFEARLRSAGVDRWDRGLTILEVCSGHGIGLRAWHALGFGSIVGVDNSAALVKSYDGPGSMVLGDARCLPFADASRDVVVIQGGLHHLPTLADVDVALSEMRRVVKPSGRLLIVEPWRTPFLLAVHAACRMPVLRRLWPRLDALAVMIEEEGEPYQRWLSSPSHVLAAVSRHMEPRDINRGWGKIRIIATPL